MTDRVASVDDVQVLVDAIINVEHHHAKEMAKHELRMKLFKILE